MSAKASEVAAELDLLQSAEREARDLAAECKSVDAKFKEAVTKNGKLVVWKYNMHS